MKMGFHYNYICVILILIYESSSIEIKRHLCLATAARFINDRNRCSFDISHADAILRDVATCANKCEFWIDHLEYERRFSLDQVRLTIGIGKTFYVCSASRPNVQPLTMYINCSSWNKDIYRVGYRANCVDYNAQCDNLSDNYCVCQCNPGYVIGYRNCVKGNVNIGYQCMYDLQCTGTPFATLCRSGFCSCQSGYISNQNSCYQENVTVGLSCSYHWQCTGTANARVCNNHRCECQSGYIMIGYNCYQEHVTVCQYCSYQRQCTGTEYASVCNHGRCECQSGYILIRNTCYKGNITVNQSCLHNRQCTGTEFAGLCTFGVCTCQAGYILIGNNCYPDHVPVGGFCSLDKQCTGSKNSETCKDGRCRCSDGHVLLDLECIQDNSIGQILGTLFGGILIGVILTAVIAFLIFKKIRTKIKKREEPIVMFANDAIYSSANVVEREDITGFQANNKKRKFVNLFPYACSEKGAVYSFVNRKPRIEQPTTEGVYNHLHEQEKHDNDDDDNYDHACAASYLDTEPSVYSNMP